MVGVSVQGVPLLGVPWGAHFGGPILGVPWGWSHGGPPLAAPYNPAAPYGRPIEPCCPLSPFHPLWLPHRALLPPIATPYSPAAPYSRPL